MAMASATSAIMIVMVTAPLMEATLARTIQAMLVSTPMATWCRTLPITAQPLPTRLNSIAITMVRAMPAIPMTTMMACQMVQTTAPSPPTRIKQISITMALVMHVNLTPMAMGYQTSKIIAQAYLTQTKMISITTVVAMPAQTPILTGSLTLLITAA